MQFFYQIINNKMIISKPLDTRINFENRDKLEGTYDKPLLINITSGQRAGESLIYHFKIEEKYRQYRINKVYNGTVNLICAHKSCKCSAKLRLDPQFIKVDLNFYAKSNGRSRSKFSINNLDPNLRNLHFWQVIQHTPKFEHNENCSTDDFYLQYRTDFRETMTFNSLRSKKPEYNLTKFFYSGDASNYDVFLFRLNF